MKKKSLFMFGMLCFALMSVISLGDENSYSERSVQEYSDFRDSDDDSDFESNAEEGNSYDDSDLNGDSDYDDAMPSGMASDLEDSEEDEHNNLGINSEPYHEKTYGGVPAPGKHSRQPIGVESLEPPQPEEKGQKVESVPTAQQEAEFKAAEEKLDPPKPTMPLSPQQQAALQMARQQAALKNRQAQMRNAEFDRREASLEGHPIPQRPLNVNPQYAPGNWNQYQYQPHYAPPRRYQPIFQAPIRPNMYWPNHWSPGYSYNDWRRPPPHQGMNYGGYRQSLYYHQPPYQYRYPHQPVNVPSFQQQGPMAPYPPQQQPQYGQMPPQQEQFPVVPPQQEQVPVMPQQEQVPVMPQQEQVPVVPQQEQVPVMPQQEVPVVPPQQEQMPVVPQEQVPVVPQLPVSPPQQEQVPVVPQEQVPVVPQEQVPVVPQEQVPVVPPQLPVSPPQQEQVPVVPPQQPGGPTQQQVPGAPDQQPAENQPVSPEVVFGEYDLSVIGENMFQKVMGKDKSTGCMSSGGLCLDKAQCKKMRWKTKGRANRYCSRGTVCCKINVPMGPKKFCGDPEQTGCNPPGWNVDFFNNAKSNEIGVEKLEQCVSAKKQPTPLLKHIWDTDPEVHKAKKMIKEFLTCQCQFTQQDFNQVHTALVFRWVYMLEYIVNRAVRKVVIKAEKRKKLSKCEATSMFRELVLKKIPSFKAGFFNAVLNEYRYNYQMPSKYRRTSMKKKPFGYEPWALGVKEVGGSSKVPVAASVVEFARYVKKRMPRISFGTYPSHSWGAYSLDCFVGAKNEQNFYKHDLVRNLMGIFEEAKDALNIEYRGLYNDFEIAFEINRKYNRRRLTYIPFHGPSPYIIHIHFDFMPKKAYTLPSGTTLYKEPENKKRI